MPRGLYEKKGYELFLKLPNFIGRYKALSNKYQIGFLMGLINAYRFSDGRGIESVLEIGVFNGVTSLYMLKEGCKKEKFDLYGIEICEGDLYGQAAVAESSDDELANYHLHTGSTAFDIENVLEGAKIDLVFIDAAHVHPFPLIDLIHAIPFLHKESIVLLHDVVDYMRPNAWGESFIYTSWTDVKTRSVNLNANLEPSSETSLGCIKIPASQDELYDNIERIARIPFRASPWETSGNYLGMNGEWIDKLHTFMTKYYSEEFSDRICGIFTANLEEYEKLHILYAHETRFFNYLFERLKKQQRTIDEMAKTIETLKQQSPEYSK
jgi:predicted O-methyltransferase YrrM